MSSLTAESWTWYALCIFVVLCRLISRVLLLGSPRQLQTDDALMVLAVATYTTLIACINIVVKSDTNLINPGEGVVHFTPEVVEKRAYGSKMVVISEQMQLLTIWLVKGCLLIMYSRLTMSTKQALAVKLVGAYVVLGFVFMEIAYFAIWCRPFNSYWAVPTANTQCSAATHHLITNAVLNISSDVLIMAIPLPIFLAARLPLKRKIILFGVFCLGTFSILSAVLNKFYSFTQPFGSAWVFWYVRESSTAIITANIPFTWTLLQRTFNIGSFIDSSRGRSRTTYLQFNPSSKIAATATARKPSHHQPHKDDLERNESQVQIVPLEIWQNVQLSVHTSHVTVATNDAAVITTDDKTLPQTTVTETEKDAASGIASSRSSASDTDDGLHVPDANTSHVTTTCTRVHD